MRTNYLHKFQVCQLLSDETKWKAIGLKSRHFMFHSVIKQKSHRLPDSLSITLYLEQSQSVVEKPIGKNDNYGCPKKFQKKFSRKVTPHRSL